MAIIAALQVIDILGPVSQLVSMTTHHVKMQRSLKMARFLPWLTLRSATYYIKHIIQNSLLNGLINNVV